MDWLTSLHCQTQTNQKNIMTRKHFKLIAETIRNRIRYTFNDAELVAIAQLAGELADQFADFNPNFNRSKFLAVALG